ncbi:serine/threonine-protein phosphatase CPPED1-like [Oppia nitens]|uniref:serine/threonine-protein phosphatase CPPED1-like n=1 Tax=Oppia nitens TaxID=1686743 RepID=UPI0023DAA551|nr:serine/threonine-protein phosphatase CPPED1-like [Oppia nitens]
MIVIPNSINSESNDAIFKRAVNRTYIGFEKEKNREWRQSYHFIQGADTQFGMIETYLKHKTDGKWDEEIQLTEEAIRQWNSMKPKPKFVVICGDLVDDFPGHEPRRQRQLDDFMHAFEKLNRDIPLVLLGGNHDFLNTPTHESIAAYKTNFGDDYFTFWVDGCMFIVINVQYYKDHQLVEDLYAEHDQWLTKQLAEAKAGNYKHVIVFQHIPWFLHNIDEPLAENFEITVRKRMIQKFVDSGIRAIFAGHYHRNAGGRYKELELVVTSAIGAQSPTGRNANSGYRVVTVNEFNISHEYIDIYKSDTKSVFEFNLFCLMTLIVIAFIIQKFIMI